MRIMLMGHKYKFLASNGSVITIWHNLRKDTPWVAFFESKSVDQDWVDKIVAEAKDNGGGEQIIADALARAINSKSKKI